MGQTTRTFVAIAVPDAPAAKLLRLQTLLAPDLPGALWTTTFPFHFTLAFLGDVPHTDLNVICGAVSRASAAVGPFSIRLEALGVFPDPAQARVVWVGATGPGLEPLGTLQAQLANALKQAGHPPNDRFHPHVTLARLKPRRDSPSDLTPLLKHYRTWSAGSFPVSEVVTFASTVTPEGPVYAPLGRASLTAGPA